MKKHYFIFLVIVFLSCDFKSQIVEPSQLKFNENLHWQDIPLNSAGKSEYFEYIRFMTRAIKDLDRLDTGYAGSQIRLWYEYPKKSPFAIDTTEIEHIVIFKRPDSTKIWSGDFISAKRRVNSNKKINGIITEKVSLNPKSGWDRFIDKILKLQITSLPDCSKLEIDLNHTPLIIEVADKYHYRLYCYMDPEYYKKEVWQAANIVKILETIEEEFAFKRIEKW